MHVADALISPAVGGTMWAAAAVLTLYSAGRVKRQLDERKVPLMGVLGAFIFAAQMVNFAVPGTGSSGHLGGGVILAILLGPPAAFITIASVITVQAVFFADGGLLALGCNVFNLGFFPAFVAYPLVYKRVAGSQPRRGRIPAAAIAASIVALQLGAFAVVIETVLSGRADLPFRTFLLLMQPIHLLIGVVEGVITAAVVSFVREAQPGLLDASPPTCLPREVARSVAMWFLVLAIVIGGGLVWFASTQPDGLEWAVSRALRGNQLQPSDSSAHSRAAWIQERTAVLPDYDFPHETAGADNDGAWPNVRAGASVSGLVGGAMSLALVGVIAFALRRGARASQENSDHGAR